MGQTNVQLPNGKIVNWVFPGESPTDQDKIKFDAELVKNNLLSRKEVEAPSLGELAKSSFKKVGQSLDTLQREYKINSLIDNNPDLTPDELKKLPEYQGILDEERERLTSKAETDLTDLRTYTFEDVNGAKDFGRWAVQQGIGQVGQAIPTAVAVGATIGTGGGALALGLTAGAGLMFNLPQFAAQNAQRQIDENGTLDWGKAIPSAIGQTTLDVLADKIGILGDLPVKGLVKKVAAKIGVGGLTGASNEAAQQFIERAQADLDLNDEEAVSEYLNSAAGGFLFGTVGGAIGGVAQHSKFSGVPETIPEPVKNVVSKQFVDQEVRNQPRPEITPEDEARINEPKFSAKLDNTLKSLGVSPDLFVDNVEKQMGILKLTDNVMRNRDFDAKVQAVKKAGVQEGFGPATLDTLYKKEGVKLFDKTPEYLFEEAFGQKPTKPINYSSPLMDQQKLTKVLEENPDLLRKLDTGKSTEEVEAEVQKTEDEILVKKLNKESKSKPSRVKEDKEVAARALKSETPEVNATNETVNMVESGKPIEAPTQAINLEEKLKEVTPQEQIDPEELKVDPNLAFTPLDSFTNSFKELQLNPLAETALNNIAYSARRKQNIQTNMDAKKRGLVSTPIRKNVEPTFKALDKSTQVGALLHSLNSLALTNPAFIKNLPSILIKQGFDFALDSGLVNPNLMKQLSTPRAKRKVMNLAVKQYGVDEAFLRNFQTPLGYREILGEMYADFYKGNLKGLSDEMKWLFNNVQGQQKLTQKALAKNKVTKVSDLFEPTGQSLDKLTKTALDQQLLKTMNALDQTRSARDVELVNQMNKLKDPTGAESLKELASQLNDVESTSRTPFPEVEQMIKRQAVRLFATPMWAYSKNPLVAKFSVNVNNFLNTRKDISEVGQLKTERAKNWLKTQPLEAKRFFDSMYRLRDEGLSFTETPEGLIANFKDGSQEVFNSPVAVEVRKDLKEFSNYLLDTFENKQRQVLKTYGIDPKTPTPDLVLLGESLQRQKLLAETATGKAPKNLEDVADSLSALVPILQKLDKFRKTEYLPSKRFGSYGLTLVPKGKNAKTINGKPTWFIKEGRAGRGIDKEDYKKVLQKIRDFQAKHPDVEFEIQGDKKKVYGSLESAKPFAVNTTVFDDDAVTGRSSLEAFINGSGIEERFSANEKIQEKIDSWLQQLRTLKSLNGNSTFLESDNAAGYSDDYEQVLTRWASSSAISLAKTLHKQDISNIFNQGIDSLQPNKYRNEKDFVKREYDYHFKGQGDMEFLSTLNYAYSFGLGLKSALVQFSSLAIQHPAVLTRYTGSITKAYGSVQTATKILTEVIDYDRLKGQSKKFQFDVAKSVRSAIENGQLEGKVPKEFGQALKYFTGTSIAADSVNAEQTPDPTKVDTGVDKVGRLVRKAVDYQGQMMSGTEQASRLISFISFYDTLSNDPTAAQAFQQLHQNDLIFQEMVRTNPEQSLETLAATYLVQNALGTPGKQGRAGIFRGAGRLLLPFQTFSSQMFGLAWRLFTSANNKGAPGGRKAAAVLLGSALALAGTGGLYLWDIIEFLYESMMNMFSGRKHLLDQDIRKAMVTGLGDSWGNFVGDALNYGLPAATIGVDLSGSLSNQTPGVDFVRKVLGPNPINAWQALGPAGAAVDRYLKAPSGAGKLSTLIPSKGVQDLVKAYGLSSEGYSTGKGRKLLDAEDFGVNDVVFQATGFRPSIISKATDDAYYASLLSQTPRLDEAKLDLKTQYDDLQKAIEVKDLNKINEYRKLFNTSLGEYVREARKEGKQVTVSSTLSSIRRSYEEKNAPIVSQKELSKVGPKSGRLEELQRLKNIYEKE